MTSAETTQLEEWSFLDSRQRDNHIDTHLIEFRFVFTKTAGVKSISSYLWIEICLNWSSYYYSNFVKEHMY